MSAPTDDEVWPPDAAAAEGDAGPQPGPDEPARPESASVPVDAPKASAVPRSARPTARPVSPREILAAQDEDEADDAPADVFDGDGRRSHRAHREQVAAYAQIADDLVALAPHDLAKLELDADVHDAVVVCRDLRKSARMRQLRRLASVLRHVDARAIRDRLDGLGSGRGVDAQREKQLERWRARLLEGGDDALSDLVLAYPSADRQQLRQLIRAAGKDRTKGKAAQAYRKLLREIRALDQAAPAQPPAD